MPLHYFDRAELPTMPWKNSGGVTQEVVRVPEGADLEHFDWRVSIARIASGGLFSSFPGVDRVITLLEGDGMRLSSTDESLEHRLDQVLVPWAFRGETSLQCDWLGAECEDFNVMTRRNRCRAQVEVLGSSRSLHRATGGVLLVCGGRVMVTERCGKWHSLHTRQGLRWHDEPLEWQLQIKSGPAALLAVTISSMNP